MDPATAARLEALNREFYQRIAPEFSRSRERLNPGIIRVIRSMGPVDRLVDLGCGDGRVGLAWFAGELAGSLSPRTGAFYLGLDASPELLAARRPWPRRMLASRFDLGRPPWPRPDRAFGAAVCFAALHHLPGRPRRVAALGAMASSLRPGGSWAVSVWQFLHLERFRKRLRAWEEIGVDPAAPDPGDVILDWRRGQHALRYIHHYGEEELRQDCREAGLGVEEAFRSDGEDGRLGLYLRGVVPGPV